MKFKAFGTGRLGQDAEVKELTNGKSVIEFSVASNSFYRNKEGEKVESTDWHNIKSFVKEVNPDFMAKLTKGTQVTVDGRVSYDEYEDKNKSPQKRMFLDARISDIVIH